MRLTDLTGSRHSRLTVLSYHGSDKHKRRLWLCKCDCGNKTVLTTSQIQNGYTKSCGCYQKETAIAASTKHGHGRKSGRTKEHAAWHGLQQRCKNHNQVAYKGYGARGISVCDRWQGENGFVNFLADMGKAPSKNHSIDRIDNNKGYSPDNCRWATRKEQHDNRRCSIAIEINGQKKMLYDYARENGVSYYTLRARLKRGVPPNMLLISKAC